MNETTQRKTENRKEKEEEQRQYGSDELDDDDSGQRKLKAKAAVATKCIAASHYRAAVTPCVLVPFLKVAAP